MSDPPKVVIKSKVTITSDDDEPRSSGRESANGNFPRRSVRRKSSRKSDLSIESITLQETAPKSQPVTLKASFLRRKIKEYEGKKALDKSSSIIGKMLVSLSAKLIDCTQRYQFGTIEKFRFTIAVLSAAIAQRLLLTSPPNVFLFVH